MKKIIFSVILSSSLSFQLNAMESACSMGISPDTLFSISTFDEQKDKQEFLDIFTENRKKLMYRPNFSVDDMLRLKSINPDDPATHGKLIIKVLCAQDDRGVFELKGFLAYAMTDPTTAQAYLLAIKEADRKKGHAKRLVQFGINDALNRGATKLIATTLRRNTAAMASYEKMAKEIPGMDFKMHDMPVKSPEIQDVVCFELTVKD